MESFSAQTMELDRSSFESERFELRGCLGEGAFGVVYRAHDKLRNRLVALKVLRKLGPDTVFYFKQEFQALTGFEHPNLVRYRELFEERGRWFLSMDLVVGVALHDYVRPHGELGPLTESQLERLRGGLLGLAAALRALHAAGKVHSDVKASNLRVDGDGRAVLLDFGLVTDLGEVPRGPLGVSVGTAPYLAPEQIEGAPLGPEADWYAVGVLLFECLVGRPPFVGEPERVLEDKRVNAAPSPGNLAGPVPPDLESLCRQLLEREPAKRRGAIARFERVLGGRPATVPPQPLALPRHARFVGREAELQQLADAVLDHATPRLRLVHVYGESGLGKTALLEELWTHVGERYPEVRVLTGRCYERETVAYNALDGIVDGLVQLLGELPPSQLARLLPPDAEPLLRTFPAFSRIERLSPSAPLDDDAPDPSVRRRAFGMLRELLAGVARDAPLVVAVDDIQWADADSQRALEAIFLAAGAPPCLVVFAGRVRPSGSEPVARLLHRLEGAAHTARRVHLGPLQEAESFALAHEAFVLSPDGKQIAEQIARESGGHPLLVEVLVRHVREATEGGPVSLPVALVAAHAGLGHDAQGLSGLLALAAQPLDEAVAQAAARLPRGSFLRALASLVEAGWARVQRTAKGARLELTHERIRRLLVSHLEEVERAELHWQLAQALVEQGAGPEAIAIHFAEAGDAERALEYALEGAQAAVAACAFSHAERLYLLAHAHVPGDDTEGRRRLERELAQVHQFAGRGREAGDLYAELSRDAEGHEALELRYRAAEAWLDSGYHEEGLPWIRGLLETLGTPAPAAGAAVWWRWGKARGEALLRRGALALRDAEGLEAPERLTADALFKLTCALMTADPRRSRAAQAQHLAYALRLGDAYRLARAYALEVWLHPTGSRTHGRFGLGSDLASARRLSRASDQPHARALVQLAEGVLSLSDDRYAEASACFSASAQLLTEHCQGARWERTYALYYKSLCAFHTGEFWLVRDAVEVALQDAAAQGDVLADALWRSRLGHVPALLAHAPDAAEAALAAVHGPSRALPHAEMHALFSQVEVALYRNEAGAFDSLEERWAALERAGSLGVRSTRRRALWTRARAALCSARLDAPRRAALLRVALEMAARLEADRTPAARSRAALVRSAVHELRGQRSQALEGYARAAQLAEAAGCWAMVATADARRGSLAGDDDGRSLRARAHGYLRRAGAREPARMAALINGF